MKSCVPIPRCMYLYIVFHCSWILCLITSVQFSSVQSLSRVRLFATAWIAARQASLSITNSRSSLRLVSTESVMPSSHLILCHPLLLLPAIPPSINIRWIIEKAREFQKNICFSFIDYANAFDCVDHSKLWKILQEMGLSDHLTCLLRNMYVQISGQRNLSS